MAQKWKFGGKEYDESLGLETYDFGARNYDPALGKWMNLDPLAEKMRRYSPYNYVFDNPIFFVDSDGMLPRSNYTVPKPHYGSADIDDFGRGSAFSDVGKATFTVSGVNGNGETFTVDTPKNIKVP